MSMLLSNANSAAVASASEYFRDRWGRYPNALETQAIASAVASLSFNDVIAQINAGGFVMGAMPDPTSMATGFSAVPWNPVNGINLGTIGGWLSGLGGIVGQLGGLFGGSTTGVGNMPPGFPGTMPALPPGTFPGPTGPTGPTGPGAPTAPGLPPLSIPTSIGTAVAKKAGQYIIPAVVAGVLGDWVYDAVKGWFFRKRKHRRMNVLNPRALARADRRVTGFGKWAKKELKRFGFHVALNKRTLKHHSPSYHKKKRAS